MHSHGIFFHIYIKNTVMDRRKQNFLSIHTIYDINIIGTGLHNIAEYSEFLPILQKYIHSDQHPEFQ